MCLSRRKSRGPKSLICSINGIKMHTGKGSCKSGLLDPLAYVSEESCGIFLEDLENNLVPPHILPNVFNYGAIMN